MRLLLIASFIVLMAVAVTGAAYLVTADDETHADGNPGGQSSAYSIPARDSKHYLSELKNSGGQMAVFADGLTWRINDLLHGRSLVYLPAAGTIGVVLACFFAAALQFNRSSRRRMDGPDG
jgi:hypothetical protein